MSPNIHVAGATTTVNPTISPSMANAQTGEGNVMPATAAMMHGAGSGGGMQPVMLMPNGSGGFMLMPAGAGSMGAGQPMALGGGSTAISSSGDYAALLAAQQAQMAQQAQVVQQQTAMLAAMLAVQQQGTNGGMNGGGMNGGMNGGMDGGGKYFSGVLPGMTSLPTMAAPGVPMPPATPTKPDGYPPPADGFPVPKQV